MAWTWRVDASYALSSLNFAKIIKEKSAKERKTMRNWLGLVLITDVVAYSTFLVSWYSLSTFARLQEKWGKLCLWCSLFLTFLFFLAPILLLFFEYLSFLLLFKYGKFWKPNFFKSIVNTILPTISVLVTPLCGEDELLYVALVSGAASSLYFCIAMIPLEDLRVTEPLLSLSLAYVVYFRQDFIFSIFFLLFFVDSWHMLLCTSSFSNALLPSASDSDSDSDSDSNSDSDSDLSQFVRGNSIRSSSVHHNGVNTFSPRKDVAYTTVDGSGSGSSALMKFDQKADNVPMPIVLIDQNSDPDATILQVSFGNHLLALIDTMKVLKDLGLDVVKGTVATKGSVTWATFFISQLATGRKVEDRDLLDRIHLTISKNILKRFSEKSSQT